MRFLLMFSLFIVTVSAHGHFHADDEGMKWDCVHDKVSKNTILHKSDQVYLPPSADGRRQASEWQPIRIVVVSMFDSSMDRT
jgi:hypothetical protein